MEIDAASNNAVDDVRRLRESVGFATMTSRYRVVILDEAHMMTKSAFNAFLKTLEEPPPRVVFVLATTELHKVPETIRSRCQVLLFRRVGEQDLQKRLRTIADREQVAIPDDVLAEIAAAVRGGVRDAETALERVLPLARELGAKFDLAAYRTLVARVGIDATIGVCERCSPATRRPACTSRATCSSTAPTNARRSARSSRCCAGCCC
jgi:DNA polymerase-3 subunit gamma/tau